jgi:hypothetical protein
MGLSIFRPMFAIACVCSLIANESRGQVLSHPLKSAASNSAEYYPQPVQYVTVQQPAYAYSYNPPQTQGQLVPVTTYQPQVIGTEWWSGKPIVAWKPVVTVQAAQWNPSDARYAAHYTSGGEVQQSNSPQYTATMGRTPYSSLNTVATMNVDMDLVDKRFRKVDSDVGEVRQDLTKRLNAVNDTINLRIDAIVGGPDKNAPPKK